TRVEVDLSAVEHNARVLAEASGARLLAVIKADAYGHGAVAVGRWLSTSGAAHGFAVSLVEEAVQLREAGIGEPILVMGPSMGGAEREIITHRLWPMVSTLRALRALASAAESEGQPAEVHLKIDTGMGRLGLAEH